MTSLSSSVGRLAKDRRESLISSWSSFAEDTKNNSSGSTFSSDHFEMYVFATGCSVAVALSNESVGTNQMREAVSLRSPAVSLDSSRTGLGCQGNDYITMKMVIMNN